MSILGHARTTTTVISILITTKITYFCGFDFFDDWNRNRMESSPVFKISRESSRGCKGLLMTWSPSLEFVAYSTYVRLLSSGIVWFFLTN